MQRSKSSRRPLGDVSNAKAAVRTAGILKKRSGDGGQPGDNSLDRLLLVQSDLSSLTRQIDELVVQALQLTGNKGRKEIKQFADVLSDMQASLKPWVPRLQKALLSQSKKADNMSEHSIEKTVIPVPEEKRNSVIESPVQTKLKSSVSPSPLVSWRAECNTEGGRQLFLLTPLPQKGAFSSKCAASSIPTFENIKAEENNTQPVVNLHTKCGNPAKFLETNCSSMFVMTPRLKMSPPKSCVLLEPISEFSKKKSFRAHKSTPFPVQVQNSSESEDSESSSSNSQPSNDLMVKYPELFGIRINNLEKRMVKEEDSPDWMVSPPTTCVIMEPADEKLLENVSGNWSVPKSTAIICNQQDEDKHIIVTKTHMQSMRGLLDLTESTPMIKEPMSSFRLGKQAGENTLKKELWTKFEAATAHVIHFDEPILEDDDTQTKKGFLDRLDEALDS